jgi:uncharacterized protein CbrC (UPF0167 family)
MFLYQSAGDMLCQCCVIQESFGKYSRIYCLETSEVFLPHSFQNGSKNAAFSHPPLPKLKTVGTEDKKELYQILIHLRPILGTLSQREEWQRHEGDLLPYLIQRLTCTLSWCDV